MHWVALWKRYDRYKNDKTVWSNNYKDFIFKDDGKTKFPDIWMGVPRTPTSGWKEIKLENNMGCVLHLQFVNWKHFQIKQCWYRCSELVGKKGTVDEINKKYSITIDPNKHKNKYMNKYFEYKTTKKIDNTWFDISSLPEVSNIYKDNQWRLDQINNWFNKYGVDYFKDLDIFHVKEIIEMRK